MMRTFAFDRAGWLALATALLLPLVLPSGTLATEVLVYAMAVMACNLLLGFTGLLSFGQGIFFGLGSYALAISLTRLAWPLPAALALSVGLGAAAAALVGWFAIRRRGTYFVMLTLAFAQLFYFLAYTTPQLTGGDNGLLDVPRPPLSLFGLRLAALDGAWAFYAFVAVCFLLVCWGLQRVASSVFGRTLLAIRDNEDRAQAVGYNVRHFKLLAFVLSGAVTGLAGGLHAMLMGIAPLTSIDFVTGEMILVMTVIGGTGNLFGSVLGAAFYVLMSDWLSNLWPRWLMVMGFLLIGVSLFVRGGLWGLLTLPARLAANRRALGSADEGVAQAINDTAPLAREEQA